MNMTTKLGCYLVGWNPAILNECGEASHRTLKKYVAAILILMIIWGVVGYCFADRYIEIKTLSGKLVVAAGFMTIILCVERFVILTVGKNWTMTLFRYILAFLMAILGSAIFDQIIFKNDVDVKMKEVRTEQINKEIPKRIAYLDADITRTMGLIDSIGRANIHIYEQLSKNPVIKATDVSTTTRQTGAVDEQGKPIEEKISNVTTRNVENPLSGQAKANEAALKIYQAQLDNYQQKKMSVADDVNEEYKNASTGFLEELKALFSILTEDPVALSFYIFLFLFLVSLELLVVTSKIGDEKCDYDSIVEHQLRIKKNTLSRTETNLLNQ